MQALCPGSLNNAWEDFSALEQLPQQAQSTSVCLYMRRVTTRQNQNLFGALSQKCWGWRCLVCAIPPCSKGFPSAALHSGWAPRETPRLSTIWQSRGYIFIWKQWWWPPLEEFSLILIHTLAFPVLWGPKERQVPVLDVPQSASP